MGVWGLTFKARTDDHRDSPAVAIVERLLAAGAHVVAHDPTVAAVTDLLPSDLELAAGPLEACSGADALVLLTDWPEFALVAPVAVAAALSTPSVVDTRGVLDRREWERAGFDVRSIGR